MDIADLKLSDLRSMGFDVVRVNGSGAPKQPENIQRPTIYRPSS
jgi:hypothetical protein